MPMAFKDTRIWKAWEGIKWLFGAGEKEAIEEPTPQQQTDTWSKTLNEVAQDINRNECISLTKSYTIFIIKK